MEIISQFIARNKEFFRARIHQKDSKHVFINDWKFIISAGADIEKHLEIIIKPSDIERLMTDIEEIISEPRLKYYQEMVKLFLKFEDSYAYVSIQEELERDPFMIKDFDQLVLLHSFKNDLTLDGINNEDNYNFLTVGDINIHFPNKETWNKFIVQFCTSYKNSEFIDPVYGVFIKESTSYKDSEFIDPIYGLFIKESISLINVDDKLMINVIIPLSSIDNEIENYRETINNLVFQSFPNYSHEVTNDYELYTSNRFVCRNHQIFEMKNIKKWDSIYSKLSDKYCNLLHEFLMNFLPFQHFRYISSNYEYIHKKIRRISEIIDTPYKIKYDSNDHIVIRFKSNGIKINLAFKGLNYKNLPFKCSMYVDRLDNFKLESTIRPGGERRINFTFTSDHLNLEHRN